MNDRDIPEPLRLANQLEQTAGASSVYRDKAAAELRRMHRELKRLAQQQMQPCAGRNCGSTNPNLHSAECFEDYEKSTGMNQWVDLTEEEINNSYMFWVVDQQDVIGFGKSLETKIKRKNT